MPFTLSYSLRGEQRFDRPENSHFLVIVLPHPYSCVTDVRVRFVLFSDPPNYNGGAPILGYTLEMENTTTKGSLSKDSFNFFLCGRKELLLYGFIVAWMEYNICFSLFDF